MKIGIYTPYLSTLGGGEKYIFDIAVCISEGNEVFIFTHDKDILKKAQERFGHDLRNIKIADPIPYGIKSLYRSREYDVIFYVSDGSIPSLISKKNFLIAQFPINWVNFSLLDKIKLIKINAVICYSEFVRSHLKKTFKKKIEVIPPYIKSYYDKRMKKGNIIISVGRFTKGMNRKKQEVMIGAFKEIIDKGIKDWKLILIGSYRDDDKNYFKQIVKLSSDYPIDVIGNVGFKEILDYYNKSKIYWHASGYGEDLEKHPEFAEHFGISTVEAMGAGVVPVVFNAGGQKEIVEDNINGFLWNTLSELEEKTLHLAKEDKILSTMSMEALKRAKDFEGKGFCEEIKKMVEGI